MIHQILKRILGFFGSKQSSLQEQSSVEKNELDKSLSTEEAYEREEAIEVFKILAEQGDGDAQFELGFRFQKYHDISQNYEKAIKY
jgi:TPR repeat protein